MNIIEDIRKELGRKNMNQRTLSEKSGVTQSQISRILEGKTTPTVETLEKITAALGMEVVLMPTPEEISYRSPIEEFERLFVGSEEDMKVKFGNGVGNVDLMRHKVIVVHYDRNETKNELVVPAVMTVESETPIFYHIYSTDIHSYNMYAGSSYADVKEMDQISDIYSKFANASLHDHGRRIFIVDGINDLNDDEFSQLIKKIEKDEDEYFILMDDQSFEDRGTSILKDIPEYRIRYHKNSTREYKGKITNFENESYKIVSPKYMERFYPKSERSSYEVNIGFYGKNPNSSNSEHLPVCLPYFSYFPIDFIKESTTAVAIQDDDLFDHFFQKVYYNMMAFHTDIIMFTDNVDNERYNDEHMKVVVMDRSKSPMEAFDIISEIVNERKHLLYKFRESGRDEESIPMKPLIIIDDTRQQYSMRSSLEPNSYRNSRTGLIVRVKDPIKQKEYKKCRSKIVFPFDDPQTYMELMYMVPELKKKEFLFSSLLSERLKPISGFMY